MCFAKRSSREAQAASSRALVIRRREKIRRSAQDTAMGLRTLELRQLAAGGLRLGEGARGERGLEHLAGARLVARLAERDAEVVADRRRVGTLRERLLEGLHRLLRL